MKRQPMVVSSMVWLRANALGALDTTYGARDIDSTPPASIELVSPARIARAAVPTASMLEPHSRLMVAPGTLCGRPASSNDMRATLRLSSPAWLAQPAITSSIAAGSRFGASARTALKTCASMSSGRTAARVPPKRPTAVRRGWQRKTSLAMGHSGLSAIRSFYPQMDADLRR